MKIEYYSENRWLFPGEDGVCTKIPFTDVDSRFHKHNYYEFFLVCSGNATHYINYREKPLCPGTLALIRPDDAHVFRKPTKNFSFYNLLVSKATMDTCLSFLGNQSGIYQMLESEIPPVQLQQGETASLIKKLEHLTIARELNVNYLNTQLKITVINLLADFFLERFLHLPSEIPNWLGLVVLEMQKPQNYQEGLPALYRISRKSPEYLCRIFKRHLNKTPTEFINEIRIDGAKFALEYTNHTIMEISEDVGYENLSHFYHLFKKRTGMSPKAFREYLSQGFPLDAV